MCAWILVLALVGAPETKTEPKPAEPPTGEWYMERFEYEGEVRPSLARGRFNVYRFTDKAMILLSAGSGEQRVREIRSDPVRFVAAAGHSHLDFGEPAETQAGIFKVDGDTLTICFGPDGKRRPTDFTAPKGSGNMVWVLKRVAMK
jgi:uncharacterized protein (TIGR03067 family)